MVCMRRFATAIRPIPVQIQRADEHGALVDMATREEYRRRTSRPPGSSLRALPRRLTCRMPRPAR